jgi:hypothetical protein
MARSGGRLEGSFLTRAQSECIEKGNLTFGFSNLLRVRLFANEESRRRKHLVWNESFI